MNQNVKTNDSTLDTLMKGIQRHLGRKIIPSRFNSYTDDPALHYIAFTNIQYTTAEVEARGGAIIDDTLMNPRIKYNVLYGEVRFGNEKGQGIGYDLQSIPLKGSFDSLAERINLMIDGPSGKGILRDASKRYGGFVSDSHWDDSIIVPNLCSIQPVRHLEDITPFTKKLIPTQRLSNLVKTCSKILSQNGNDGKVSIQVHDEIRRLATSEGTIVRDGFFGYAVMFELETRGGSKKDAPMKFSQYLYFSDEDTGTIEKRMLRLAKWMVQEVDKRKKDTVQVSNGLYPVLLYQEAMATQLHECFVHFLATDEILDYNSTSLDWENFGKMCTNPNLSVYSNPGLEGKWGSMKFDHEGVPAKRRLLVDKGVLRGYLADRNGAYHLSRLTGAEILPGDARIGYSRGCSDAVSQPRISNLEFEYHKPTAAKSRKGMFQQFVKYLQDNNLEKGILLPDSSSAASLPDQGLIEANPHFPYVVTASGEMHPARFLTTQGDLHTFLNNIVSMGGPTEYIPHECATGDGNIWRWVRAGISCGTGIVKDLHIYSQRPEELRQPRLKS
ncbi:MAG: metallopeptidase TldD-related protein [Nanoarchaeota archaeon]|nr:metallopeptidase TldD-related protein [Nanoarchaeota archaeon]